MAKRQIPALMDQEALQLQVQHTHVPCVKKFFQFPRKTLGESLMATFA
jgi:hypothetical protein